MITKVKSDFMSLIYNALSNEKFSDMNRPRKYFIAYTIWLFSAIKGRINFLQLKRFGNCCEQYFRIGFQRTFEFLDFNTALLKGHLSNTVAVAMDPSYISKTGKCTAGVGYFWSGCASKAKWGLEICGFAVVDVAANTAYHLKAFQSPNAEKLKETDATLLSHYGGLVQENASNWKEFSNYLLADAFFSKKTFVDQVVNSGMHLVCRLRDDADLKYLYDGPKKPGKGRPKQYDGKLNVNNPNMHYFTPEEQTAQYLTYSAVVYSKALKRKIRLALVIFPDTNGQPSVRKLYFSTDTSMTACLVFKYYRSRFQIEFLYRDAKQYTGLCHGQGRSSEKIDFHVNAALTTVNVAKIQHMKNNRNENFSMANAKTVNYNVLLLERFIEAFGINQNTAKNKKRIKKLLEYGQMAA
jgi:Transposase DDE domain.